jgi:hypothetical protein
VAFLSTTGRGTKALYFSNTTPKSWRPDWFSWSECTPENAGIQIFVANSWVKSVA